MLERLRKGDGCAEGVVFLVMHLKQNRTIDNLFGPMDRLGGGLTRMARVATSTHMIYFSVSYEPTMADSQQAGGGNDDDAETCKEQQEKIVIVGDLHGNLDDTKRLWAKIQNYVDGDAGGDDNDNDNNDNINNSSSSSSLEQATIIFLGDYVDRGPDSKGVLDFLIHLQQTRKPNKTYFLCGNHDFGMGCYLGCLPPPKSKSKSKNSSNNKNHQQRESQEEEEEEESILLDATLDPKYKTGYYPHKVQGGMHYQGRRWGGSHVYNAETTFQSYGIPFFDINPTTRQKFIDAVPESHKQFLSKLQWIYDDQTVSFPPGRLICVHAGLVNNNNTSSPSTENQIEALKDRDWMASILHEEGNISRFPAFVGRESVIKMPYDLKGKTILVSGHHGFYMNDEKDRYIIDESGGVPAINKGIQALILPERVLLNSRR